MVDRVKLIEGLNVCKEYAGELCPKCPYYHEEECLKAIATDALKLIAELDDAYHGAEKLLEQKSILFDDAVCRLKERDTVTHALAVLKENGWKEDRTHEAHATSLPNENPYWMRYRCGCGQMLFGWKYCPECGRRIQYSEGRR